MLNFVTATLSIIVGITCGCLLGSRLRALPQSGGATVTIRASRQWLVPVLAVGVGGIVGALSSYLGEFIFVLLIAALQNAFATVLGIIFASVVSGLVAAFLYAPVARLLRAPIVSKQWGAPAAGGIGFGFTFQFVPLLGGDGLFAILVGISAGMVAALAIRLTQRDLRSDSSEDTKVQS